MMLGFILSLLPSFYFLQSTWKWPVRWGTDLRHSRLLITIISHTAFVKPNTGRKTLEYVNTQLKNIRDMCEGGLDVGVHLHTASDPKPYQHLLENGMLWCGRIGRSIKVAIFSHNLNGTDHNKALPCIARSATWDARDAYDWFLQTEDDVDIRLSTLLEFWRVYPLVQNLLGGFRPGWVMYDRDDMFLTLTQFGAANSTAKMHSKILKDAQGNVFFATPSYMCGFFFDRVTMEHYQRENKFVIESLNNTLFASAPWKQEFCNGLQFSENRAIPLDSWGRLMVQHLTNKYAPDGHTGLRLKARDFLAEWGYTYNQANDKFVKINTVQLKKG